MLLDLITYLLETATAMSFNTFQCWPAIFENFHAVPKGVLAEFKNYCRSACLSDFPQMRQVVDCNMMRPVRQAIKLIDLLYKSEHSQVKWDDFREGCTTYHQYCKASEKLLSEDYDPQSFFPRKTTL